MHRQLWLFMVIGLGFLKHVCYFAFDPNSNDVETYILNPSSCDFDWIPKPCQFFWIQGLKIDIYIFNFTFVKMK